MKDIRVAAVICQAPLGRVGENLDRTIRWIEKAKEKGAQIVCFPEMNITGYGTHEDTIKIAIPLSNGITDQLLESARINNITILAGMAELGEGNRVFITHLVIDPRGRVGIYRKLHLSPPEQGIYTPGNKLPVFEIDNIRFGIQLCYDAHFPELSTIMALNGADIIFIPHASPRKGPEEKYNSWMRHLPARAYDNGLYVVACNQAGDNENGLVFPGIALIVDPLGLIFEKYLTGKEGMIVSDLKAEKLAQVREHRMRYFLPNRRPELYDFIFKGSHKK